MQLFKKKKPRPCDMLWAAGFQTKQIYHEEIQQKYRYSKKINSSLNLLLYLAITCTINWLNLKLALQYVTDVGTEHDEIRCAWRGVTVAVKVRSSNKLN